MTREHIYWAIGFTSFMMGLVLGIYLTSYNYKVKEEQFMKEVDAFLDLEAEGKAKGNLIFIPIEK